MLNEELYLVDIYQEFSGKIHQVESVYVLADSKSEAAKKAKLLYEVEMIVPEGGIRSYGKVM